MKRIIDIDEETLKEINRCGLFLNPRDKENLVNSIKHGTPLPENPTNGDMIKALFPRDYVKIYDRSVSSWWNAPYKRGETE